MKQSTLNALNHAYVSLQRVVDELYAAAQAALDREDFNDASLLTSKADKLYEEVESIDVLLIELEG